MAVKTSDPAKVINDFKRWVDRIHYRAEEKVEEAVSRITNTTNRQYASNNLEQRVQLTQDPIYYRFFPGRNRITGIASAKDIREFIYLEFGTRQSANDSLRIINGWESGIDALRVAAPYKSQSTKFYWKEGPILGRYYFLNTIDQEGMKFIRDFWK